MSHLKLQNGRWWRFDVPDLCLGSDLLLLVECNGLGLGLSHSTRQGSGEIRGYPYV